MDLSFKAMCVKIGDCFSHIIRFVFCPHITFAVHWALNTNQLITNCSPFPPVVVVAVIIIVVIVVIVVAPLLLLFLIILIVVILVLRYL